MKSLSLALSLDKNEKRREDESGEKERRKKLN
jgi:hypothetical protein